MEPADITRWLATGQDYAQGAALYAALGTNRTYHRLFALPPTAYSRQVLERELRALVALPPAAPEPAPAPASAPVVEPPAAPAPAPTALLEQLRSRLRGIRDRRSQLHAQLDTPRLRKTDRFQMACTILDLTDEEQDVSSQLEHVRVHGRLPGPVPAAELQDAGELRQRLTNLLSHRSKLRKQPQKAGQLAQVEADITLIRQKLNSQSL